MMAPHDETIRLTIIDASTAVDGSRLDWVTLERYVASRYGRRYVCDLDPNDVTCRDDDAASTIWLGLIFGVDRRTIQGRRSTGTLRLWDAEHLCDHLGVHPFDVWGPRYYEIVPDNATDAESAPRMLNKRLARDARYLERMRAS